MGKRMNGLDMAGTSGLSELEATERLRLEGANELPTTKPRTVWHIALEVIREPMFLLLILAGTIYFVLGDVGEGVMLLGFVVVVMGITMYQERKTERALEALRDLSSPRALVIRDHVPRRIAGREVVRDDILVLAEGDRIPADALLISDLHLSVDESLLTGESVAVNKLARADSLEFARPSGGGTPFLFSGTLVVQGEGLARVVATGSRTELGKIGTALRTVNVESTTLKLETDRLVRLIASGGLVLCVLVVLGYGLLRGHWLEGLLAGIALAMALLPEEIPVILTVFMALGAWRIAQHQVLTRRAQVIETLGSATVLCVDKTGTLTQNRMTVAGIATNHERCDVTHSSLETFPEAFHTTLEFGILASHSGSFDPMERALAEAGDRLLVNTEHLHGDWNLVREYPLSAALLALSHVWRATDGRRSPCWRCSSSIAVLAASGLIIRASAPRFLGSLKGRCGSRANRLRTDLANNPSMLFSSAARACPVVFVTMTLMFCIPALTAFKPSVSPKAVAAESSNPFAVRLA
jgi:P-type Ca2+ transporter type 2C